MTDYIAAIEEALTRALTWNTGKIDAFFATLEGDAVYVKNFFIQDGPILVAAAKALAAIVTPIDAAAGALITECATVFNTIVTSLAQTSSPAASVMSTDPLGEAYDALVNLQAAMAAGRKKLRKGK
jgi:hypothetical protein